MISSRKLEDEFLRLVEAVQIGDPEVVAWLREVLLEMHDQESTFHDSQIKTLQRRYTVLKKRLDSAYAEYLDGKIDQEQHQRLKEEWTQEREDVKARLAEHERAADTYTELGVQVVELCQALPERWLASELAVKRELLDILLLNCTFDGATLAPTYRKPFDLLAEGLVCATGGGVAALWRGDARPRPPSQALPVGSDRRVSARAGPGWRASGQEGPGSCESYRGSPPAVRAARRQGRPGRARLLRID